MNNNQLLIPKNKINRICIIWFGLIGDTLVREPTLENLKTAYPDAKITIIVDSACQPLFRHHPSIDHIIGFKRSKGANLKFIWDAFQLKRYLNQQRFDLVVNFYGGGYSLRLMKSLKAPYRLGFINHKQAWTEKHRIYTHQAPKECTHAHWGQAFSRLLTPLGIQALTTAKPPRFYINEPSLSITAKALLTNLSPKKFAMFHLTSGGAEKIWPLENFIAIANWLNTTHQYHIVLITSPGHETLTTQAFQKLNNQSQATCLPLLALDELATVMAKAQFLVTGDTGPMHLAFAVRCPGLILLPHTPPEYIIPDEVTTEYCFHPNPNDIRKGIHFGINDINVNEVKAAAERLMQKIER